MRTEINREIFSPENKQLHIEYIELLINRLTHSNMSLELDLGNPDDSKNAIRLRDNMKAFKSLLNISFSNEKISEKIIIDTANTINESSQFISNGYRKIGAKYIADSKIPITPAEDIQAGVYNLLQKYENDWKDLDVFEREARFHIEFILIHPFEDGNGRTSRLLMNFNLLRQGQAPVIITGDLLEYYHEYIRSNDISRMEHLFRIQSLKENDIIEHLYDEFTQKNLKRIKF